MLPRRLAIPCFHALRARGYAEKIFMPALSPTMEAGTIATWKKKVGDKLRPGDVLCSVETDKATLDFEWAGDEGIIAQLAFEPGHEPVPVGTPIAALAEDEADLPAAKAMDLSQSSAPKAAKPAAAAAPAAPAPSSTPPPSQPSAPQATAQSTAAAPKLEPYTSAKVRASPAAMAVFAKHIQGTGPNGRIVEADVEAYFKNAGSGSPAAAAAPAAPGSLPAQFEDTTASLMRKSIASRLTASKVEIPHFYLTVDVAVGKMKEMVAVLNAGAKNGDFKITVNDFLVKACALACKKVPATNSQWLGDKIRQFHTVDISVAVATPTGLITPIVFNADLKGLKEISNDIKGLAALAREGKLTPEQYTGGTFTISNLGSYGVKHFTAIINPPQACILAVGAAQENGMMSVTLSCDHRVVDGAVGATWLQAFKGLIEAPASLLL